MLLPVIAEWKCEKLKLNQQLLYTAILHAVSLFVNPYIIVIRLLCKSVESDDILQKDIFDLDTSRTIKQVLTAP